MHCFDKIVNFVKEKSEWVNLEIPNMKSEKEYYIFMKDFKNRLFKIEDRKKEEEI